MKIYILTEMMELQKDLLAFVKAEKKGEINYEL